MDSWELGIKIRFLERRIADLERQLEEADRFGMQNRQLVADNLDLKQQLAETDGEVANLHGQLMSAHDEIAEKDKEIERLRALADGCDYVIKTADKVFREGSGRMAVDHIIHGYSVYKSEYLEQTE